MRAKLRGAILLTVGFLIVLGMISILRARLAVQQARFDVAANTLPFEIRPVSDTKPESIEFLPATPDFRDVQIFHDSLVACGSPRLAHLRRPGPRHHAPPPDRSRRQLERPLAPQASRPLVSSTWKETITRNTRLDSVKIDKRTGS